MDQKVRESIEHDLHPHALVLNDEGQSDQIKKACCSACLESLSFGPSFSCGECKFHLHKKCAEAPLQINQSPFHHHPYLYIKLGTSYFCDLCGENRTMFIYACPSCHFCLDFKCALLLHNIDENFRKVKHFAHEHQLSFFETPPKDTEIERADCYWCRKPLVESSIYVCLPCRFYLHKKCDFPAQPLDHYRCRRMHPFSFEFCTGSIFCKACQSKHGTRYSFFFRCSPCKLDLHIKCGWSPPTIEGGPHHEHPFVRFFRNAMFTCDACGTHGNYVSYICPTCNFQVHQNCISLPPIIQTTRHPHPIVHRYSLQEKEFDEKQEYCQLCFMEAKTEHGKYSCLEQDCNFVAHVKCAMAMYNVIHEAENQYAESSYSVIERNEHGEATKIKHFSHEHFLTLGNEINEDDDKRCDGCMLFISTSFYSCSECGFLLHKICAELPRTMHLWFHRSLTTLNFLQSFVCTQCKHFCSGLLYKSNEQFRISFCVRCAGISPILKYQGHNHPLFFDFEFQGQCNACGATCENGAFRCKDCTLALDFTCITLPQRAPHKCDSHLLTLAFHDENDDPEQHQCDICEEERDPNLWYYHCSTCDNSTHPKCVLGKCPFVKDEITLPSYMNPHRHDLIFVKNIDFSDFPCICFSCDEICLDAAFKCFQCNSYYRHVECVNL